ncbi:MAG: ribosome biogenesis GTPase Der [bacterium]
MAYPVVAIVGRPNVGKSTFFNRLIKQNKALVDDCAGVTRDRNYGLVNRSDRLFIAIDTGGFESADESSIQQSIKEQIFIAISEADYIICMFDGKEGLMPGDRDICLMLKKCEKPIMYVINKVDNQRIGQKQVEFFELGIEKFFSISATSGKGIRALEQELLSIMTQGGSKVRDEEERICVSIVGRPNVGKSSLINTILRQDRVLVSSEPGTTRDIIDSNFNYNYRKYTILDTAGIRKRKKIKAGFEKLFIFKAIKNIASSDVVLVVIDATSGITEQDQRIGRYVREAGKAAIVAVNKWDLIEKDNTSYKRFEDAIRNRFKYLNYAPIIMISALTGQRVYSIFSLVEKTYDQSRARISTSKLNQVILKAVAACPPSHYHGKRIKFYYQTQVSISPPTFIFFVNYPKGIHFSYQRYLKNRIREKCGLEYAPINLLFRAKSKHAGL